MLAFILSLKEFSASFYAHKIVSTTKNSDTNCKQNPIHTKLVKKSPFSIN